MTDRSEKRRKRKKEDPDNAVAYNRKQLLNRKKRKEDPEYTKIHNEKKRMRLKKRMEEDLDYKQLYKEQKNSRRENRVESPERRKRRIRRIVNYQIARRKRDPVFRLNCNMGCSISKALKKNKRGRHWEDLVGYTLKELIEHLESKFLPRMSWDNRDKWHIDHIIPKSLWNYEVAKDDEFRKCWSLANLQPLWAKDNCKKGNRIAKREAPKSSQKEE